MRFLPRALYSVPPIRIHFQSCWNCGRPALETCGGCGIARYCGSFCQHRDWEAGGHHATCNNPPPREPRRSASRSPPRIASAAQSSVNEANIVAPIPASGTTKGKWRYDGNYYRLRRFARPVQYDSRWLYTHYTHTHTHTRTSFLLTENHTSSAFLSPLSSYAFALSCAIQLYNYNSLNILLFIQGILGYILSNSSVRANLGEFEVKRSLACRDIQTQSCGNRLHLRVKWNFSLLRL